GIEDRGAVLDRADPDPSRVVLKELADELAGERALEPAPRAAPDLEAAPPPDPQLSGAIDEERPDLVVGEAPAGPRGRPHVFGPPAWRTEPIEPLVGGDPDPSGAVLDHRLHPVVRQAAGDPGVVLVAGEGLGRRVVDREAAAEGADPE